MDILFPLSPLFQIRSSLPLSVYFTIISFFRSYRQLFCRISLEQSATNLILRMRNFIPSISLILGVVPIQQAMPMRYRYLHILTSFHSNMRVLFFTISDEFVLHIARIQDLAVRHRPCYIRYNNFHTTLVPISVPIHLFFSETSPNSAALQSYASQNDFLIVDDVFAHG
jgi:hypothetical protein